MTHTLTANYEGAALKLTFSESGEAVLHINGNPRESANAGSQLITLKLGSPVQTGYEHHEFIEALVTFQASSIEASLATGGQVLAQTAVERAAALE
jgi:hypothetical protein